MTEKNHKKEQVLLIFIIEKNVPCLKNLNSGCTGRQTQTRKIKSQRRDRRRERREKLTTKSSLQFSYGFTQIPLNEAWEQVSLQKRESF